MKKFLKLFDLANEPKSYLWVEGADHNDLEIVAGASYTKALQQFAVSLPKIKTP